MVISPPIEFTSTIKFLCSYGGKIVPRYPDGKLRYHGGHTRVLAVSKTVSFPELVIKMGELCGTQMNIRCQLPTEDLDALITVKSNEDLINLIEEYDRFTLTTKSPMKIRAFLLPFKPTNNKSSPSPPSTSPNSLSPSSLSPSSSFNYSTVASSSPRNGPVPVAHPMKNYSKNGSRSCRCRDSNRVYLVHNGNYYRQ